MWGGRTVGKSALPHFPTSPLTTFDMLPIDKYPVQVTIPVQWAEMDVYGHVNNAVFFRYFEIARIEFLTRVGFIETFDTQKRGAILHSTSCRFRLPLRHPDTVTVGARVHAVKEDRFDLDYVVVNGDGDIAAEGTSTIVSYDYEANSKAPIPPVIRKAIEELTLV